MYKKNRITFYLCLLYLAFYQKLSKLMFKIWNFDKNIKKAFLSNPGIAAVIETGNKLIYT